MGRNWKEWAIAALIRAVKTFAQTLAASITVGATMAEIDWPRALSVSGVSFVLSVVTSLGGLPEVESTKKIETSATSGYVQAIEGDEPPDRENE